MQNKTWFVVADQSRVLVFEEQKPGVLQTIHAFDHPEARQHVSDLMTGSRGRRRDAGPNGGHRSAMEPTVSVQQTEVEKFAHTIGEWLHIAATREAFDALILVAGPQMLGVLRDVLTKPVADRLVDTLDKVYTQLRPDEVVEALHKHFPDWIDTRVPNVPAAARQGNQQPAG